jgi:uncharacterized protein (TIGR00369 family)
MKEILKYPNCFVCGDKNIHGIKAIFYFDGEKAFTEILADEKFEGYKGIYHGGVISSLLDEVMIKAILASNKFAVTAELTVKYKIPVKVGEKLKFIGVVLKDKSRLFITEGSAVGEDGTVYATATGKYVLATDELKNQLMKSSDK